MGVPHPFLYLTSGNIERLAHIPVGGIEEIPEPLLPIVPAIKCSVDLGSGEL